MKITINKIDTTTYKGEKSFYTEIDGKKAKLKGFEEAELRSGLEIEGDLKAWEFDGKTGFNFWKAKEKKISAGNVANEQLQQIYNMVFEQNKLLLEMNEKLDNFISNAPY